MTKDEAKKQFDKYVELLNYHANEVKKIKREILPKLRKIIMT